MTRILVVLSVLGVTLYSFAYGDNEPPAPEAMWTPQTGDVIAFDVLRKGKEFGTHIVMFETGDTGDLRVTTDVDLRAGLGPITVFRYALDTSETWRNGQLVSLDGQVNDDGTREQVSATSDGETLNIDGTENADRVPLGILPASHWNVRQTEATQLLSSENGAILDVEVTEQGTETLSIAGTELAATRYLMASDIDVTLWYDTQGRWVKLAFSARGQDIEYVLRDLY